MDVESEFLKGLIALQYGELNLDLMKKQAAQIKWARGWPLNDEAFWNAEAFMWDYKIDKETRSMILNELSCLQGKNLDLGCGAYSYIPSVGLDFSEKMLKMNDNCYDKVVASLEDKLPFRDNTFDSVTVIFVLNYVSKLKELLLEIRRVVRKDFVVVLSSKKLNGWHRQKEVNSFSVLAWENLLKNYFLVEKKEFANFVLFSCK